MFDLRWPFWPLGPQLPTMVKNKLKHLLLILKMTKKEAKTETIFKLLFHFQNSFEKKSYLYMKKKTIQFVWINLAG